MKEAEYKALYHSLREKLEAAAGGASVAESGDVPLSAVSENAHVQTMLRRLGLVQGKRGRISEESDECLRDLSRAAREGVEGVGRTILRYAAGPRGDGAGAICGSEPRCRECPAGAICRHHSPRPTIKSMPEDERPRERLIRGREDQLSDIELLAIIIRDGTPKASALDLARDLLSRYGTFRQMSEATVSELCAVKGIGPAKAAQIKAALTIARRFRQERLPQRKTYVSPEDVFRHFSELLRDEKKETFWTVLLSQKNEVIREELISIGSLAESLVHPREAFKGAVRDSAAAVLFVHNHPSGNAQPSAGDIEITKRLAMAGQIMGISVLDHIIIGGAEYVSLKKERLM